MQTYLNLEVSDDTSPIQLPQFQFQADTMQVPCGQHSILWALGEKEVTAAEAIVYLALNHGSSWNSGMTWCTPSRYLAGLLGPGMSVRYTRSVLKRLIEKGWIIAIPMSGRRVRYRLVHHLCDAEDVPVDRDGKPLKLEFRVNRTGKKWKPVLDADRQKIPSAVTLEFECHISAKREVEAAVFGTDMHYP